MSPTSAFVGIDVAFSKSKRLPISICIKDGCRLSPLSLRQNRHLLPPRGSGNRLALEESVVEAFSEAVLKYLQRVEREKAVHIERIAIDAPRSYKSDGCARRESEKAMDELGISCITTPSHEEFEKIITKAQQHLKQVGTEHNIPHANQLWMLVGFSLFSTLGKEYECIEVYPQAIVSALKCADDHKTTDEGYTAQLRSIASVTGWDAKGLADSLSKMGFGAKHDRLDAFMSAWVASLPTDKRKPCGNAPDDVIWVPTLPE